MKSKDLEQHNYVRDKLDRRIYMENPLKNLDLKNWADIALVIVVVPFLSSFSAMLISDDRTFTTSLTVFLGGVVVFCIGGKLAHYRYHDGDVGGNDNAWFSGWRHSFWVDLIALVGVCLMVYGVYRFFVL